MSDSNEKDIDPANKVRMQFTLWDLMTLGSGGVALGTSWSSARLASTAFGCGLTLTLGLLLSITCVWLIRVIGSAAVRKIDLRRLDVHNLPRRVHHAILGMYAIAALWIVAASAFTGFSTHWLVRLTGL